MANRSQALSKLELNLECHLELDLGSERKEGRAEEKARTVMEARVDDGGAHGVPLPTRGREEGEGRGDVVHGRFREAQEL